MQEILSIPPLSDTEAAPGGRFCRLDLAAIDADRAMDFYTQVFGWTAHETAANGGRFTRFCVDGQDIASLYQLNMAQLDGGVPSHWTAYIHVTDIDDTARRVVANGGTVIVAPFVVDGIARIALVLDAVGAHVGLWQPLSESAHG